MKLSGADAGSKSGPPAYADRIAIARALVRAAPERCVWGFHLALPQCQFRQ